MGPEEEMDASAAGSDAAQEAKQGEALADAAQGGNAGDALAGAAASAGANVPSAGPGPQGAGTTQAGAAVPPYPMMHMPPFYPPGLFAHAPQGEQSGNLPYLAGAPGLGAGDQPEGPPMTPEQQANLQQQMQQYQMMMMAMHQQYMAGFAAMMQQKAGASPAGGAPPPGVPFVPPAETPFAPSAGQTPPATAAEGSGESAQAPSDGKQKPATKDGSSDILPPPADDGEPGQSSAAIEGSEAAKPSPAPPNNALPAQGTAPSDGAASANPHALNPFASMFGYMPQGMQFAPAPFGFPFMYPGAAGGGLPVPGAPAAQVQQPVAQTYKRRLQRGATSLEVFESFVKVAVDSAGRKTYDASRVLSRACYDAWVKSRKNVLRNPEEAFRKAVVSYITVADGASRPFAPEVEANLLKHLRRREIWPCFAGKFYADGKPVLIGSNGVRCRGYHEQQKLDEALPEDQRVGRKRVRHKRARRSFSKRDEAEQLLLAGSKEGEPNEETELPEAAAASDSPKPPADEGSAHPSPA